MTIVLLDSGPLGFASNPSGRSPGPECAFWLRSLPSRGFQAALPEIADYEVRRELIRSGKANGIRRLNDIRTSIAFLPITSPIMLLAAELWAESRSIGRPTAHEHDLDGDVILAAQATVLAKFGEAVIVATTNLRHLSRFVDARLWTEIL